MHSEFFVVSQETADRINAAKQNGRRIIAVGTTSVRTLESATNDDGILQGISGWTQIFIYPGYKFKMIDALVTNFHLPQSTLLMLISALAGREHCLAAYEEAVRERYRFFSFGDAMFIRWEGLCQVLPMNYKRHVLIRGHGQVYCIHHMVPSKHLCLCL